MYATQWTLANFYFRHDQPENFWPAAQRALCVGDVAAYDPVPLFRLCWKLTRDPAAILERAIPNVGPVQARYLEFLVRENLTRAAKPLTERVVALGGEADLGAVYEYCDRLIAAGDAGGALDAWNALCRRRCESIVRSLPKQGFRSPTAISQTHPSSTGSTGACRPRRASRWSAADYRRGFGSRSTAASRKHALSCSRCSPSRLHAGTGCGSAIRRMV
jgi:hypothetical protein